MIRPPRICPSAVRACSSAYSGNTSAKLCSVGDGSEQNAALARAVMGGVAVGTCSTLLFVPFPYSLMRRGTAKALADYLDHPQPESVR